MAETLTISRPGYFRNNVYKGLVDVRAHNVTFEGCTFDGDGGQYAVKNGSWIGDLKPQNTRFLDCSITNARKGALLQSARLERCLIHRTFEDGIFIDFPGNVVILDCTFTSIGDPDTVPGLHADGVQMAGGKNVIIRDCAFDMADPWTNACVFIECSLAPIKDVYVINNAMHGGNYCIYVKEEETRPENGYPMGVVVKGNTFEDFKFGPYYFSATPVSFSEKPL